jgi:hypothetical protein
MINRENPATEHDGAADSVDRPKLISVAALSGTAFLPLAATLKGDRPVEEMKAEEIKEEKIRRAMFADRRPSRLRPDGPQGEPDGPSCRQQRLDLRSRRSEYCGTGGYAF